MTLDTQKLRSLAEKATPGKWSHNNHGWSPWVYSDKGWDLPHLAEAIFKCGSREDADFIIAAQPQTVIALLDEIERLTMGQEGLAAAWTTALADNDEAREQLRKVFAMKECDCQGVGHAPWCRFVTEVFKSKSDGDLARAALDAMKREHEKLRQQLTAMTAARDEAAERAMREGFELAVDCAELCDEATCEHDKFGAHINWTSARETLEQAIAELRKVGAP